MEEFPDPDVIKESYRENYRKDDKGQQKEQAKA